MRKPLQGALIAAAAAALFVTAPAVHAGDEAKSEVKCMGANECKGKGACGGESHACAGKNECKGKGFIKAESAEACEEAGGTVG